MAITDETPSLRPGISPIKRAEVERLLGQGLRVAVVARMTRVSDTTVARIRDEISARDAG